MAPDRSAGQDLGKCSTGLPPHVAAFLSYVLGFVTGLIFFLIEKENKFVKFHALQSTLLSLAYIVLANAALFLPFLGILANLLINLAGLILWVVLLVKSYQGEWFKLPVIGDIAAKQTDVP